MCTCVQAYMLTCLHAYMRTRLHACAYMFARLYALICLDTTVFLHAYVLTCLLATPCSPTLTHIDNHLTPCDTYLITISGRTSSTGGDWLDRRGLAQSAHPKPTPNSYSPIIPCPRSVSGDHGPWSGPLAVWPSLHKAYALFLDSWHQAEVGGSPRLKLLPHRMHMSFRNDSRGAMEASVRIEQKKIQAPSYFFVVSAPSTWPRRPLGINFTPDAPGENNCAPFA